MNPLSFIISEFSRVADSKYIKYEDVVPVTSGGTGIDTVSAGDILVGGDNDVFTKLPIGAFGEVLTVDNGGGLVWTETGGVTEVNFEDGNGFVGTVYDHTTEPKIALATDVSGMVKGDAGALVAAAAGVDYLTFNEIGQEFVQVFLGGVDFTAGTSDTITLSSVPDNATNLDIVFDGATQQSTEWSLNLVTGVVTFTETIPLYVKQIQAKWRGANVVSVGEPSDNTVSTSKITTGAVTNSKLAPMPPNTVKGAGNDGVASDLSLDGLIDADEVNASTSNGLISENVQGQLDEIVTALQSLLPNGTIVNRGYSEYTSAAAITATIPSDDSPPLIGEGTEILSVTITPQSATNRFRLRFGGFGACSSTGNILTVALFSGSTLVNATATEQVTGQDFTQMFCEGEIVSGTTSPITFTVRAGPNVNSAWFNASYLGTRFYGGSAKATLVVEEIKSS